MLKKLGLIFFSLLVFSQIALGNSLLNSYISFPSAGFNDPSDISGLVMWLDADQITGLSDGDNVPTWNDSSSNSNDWIQTTAADQPTYNATSAINSKPAVYFTSGDFMNPETWFDSTIAPSVVDYFVVFQNLTTGGSPQRTHDIFQANIRGFYWGLNYFSEGRIVANFGTGSTVDGDEFTPESINTTYLLRIALESNDSFYEVDGTTWYTNTTDTYAPLQSGDTTPKLGSSIEWVVAEIIMYNKKLDATELSNIETYLDNKYAIPGL